MQSSALPLGHAAEGNKDFTSGDRISQTTKDLLVLSNGHGEDLIALRILEALHLLEPSLTFEVLPLVGEGKAFEKAVYEKWLIKIGPSFRLPSGGFSNQSFSGLIRDISAGVFCFAYKHWRYVRRSALHGKVILAVGDLLPLFFAWSGGGMYGFIGTPKSDYTWTSSSGALLSDYYHRCKGSEWDPWEWVLMRSLRCKFVGVRDKLTARGLQRKSIRAFAPGNPMMDGFHKAECPQDLLMFRRLLLLCGSRMPEALMNFRRLISAALQIKSPTPLAILVTTGADPSLHELELCLEKLGFSKFCLQNNSLGVDTFWQKDRFRVFIGIGKFHEWATYAEIGLANAGTATEQLVGLGTPCVSLPGKGPQFKKSFAMRQARLLGGAVFPCRNSKHLAESVEVLLRNDSFREQLSLQGVKRMGAHGGSAALAQFALELLVRS
ncbi:lipid-A-disaccharide synthase-related protein [Prochlorococcus marinus]|uniref:lipid-A-disaccharide synthase-related protein n=1 Tax=Prochlorococcus marinus TaxID=1219 RepID=UPI000B34A4F3|nr:lipid-A-disaccharide synthase-related protein [Prochlorococcus marinus]